MENNLKETIVKNLKRKSFKDIEKVGCGILFSNRLG